MSKLRRLWEKWAGIENWKVVLESERQNSRSLERQRDELRKFHERLFGVSCMWDTSRREYLIQMGVSRETLARMGFGFGLTDEACGRRLEEILHHTILGLIDSYRRDAE